MTAAEATKTPGVPAKCPTGIQGSTKSPAAACPRAAHAGVRRRGLRQDAAGDDSSCAARRSSRAGRVHGLRGDGSGVDPERPSLGFDLEGLVEKKKLVVDYVHIERSEIEETGEYDLEGLFVRLDHAIDSIGAKRVVLDTLEALFGGLPNEAILRAELRRLFRWLKDKGVTAVITAERGRGTLTRHGLEEYVSDCVILLDHRVNEQIATRHLRVVKYRGALHGTNEFPFLIGDDGISRAADHVAGAEPQGVERADFHRHPAARRDAGRAGVFPRQQHSAHGHARHRQDQLSPPFCRSRLPARRARALLLVRGIARTRSSATCIPSGSTWSRWSPKGLLRFHPRGPRSTAWKCTWRTMFKEITDFQPAVVIVDPITNHLARARSEARGW